MKLIKLTIYIFAILTLFFAVKEVNAAVIHRAPNNLGLVGYWSFNDATSTKATDFSGNKNTGTLTGANGLPRWTGGKLGSALSFDGVDDYVTAGDINALDNISAVTFTAWVKPNSPSTLKDIVGKWSSSGNNGITLHTSYDYGTDDILWGGWNGNTFLESTTNWFTNNTWHFVVGVFDGTQIGNAGRLKLYGDGVLQTVSYTGTVPATTPNTAYDVRIGADSEGGRNFPGVIDDVRVYNRALTATEVANLYKSSALVQVNPSAQNKALTSGLVGLWSFNGQDMDWSQTSAEARDRSGQNNHGDVIGPKVAIGQVGQALSFDGVDDYVNANSGTSLDNLSAISVSAWIYPKSTGEGTFGAVVSKLWDFGGSPTEGWYFGFTGSANSKLYFGVDYATDLQVISSNSVSLNSWQHVVVSWNGSQTAVGNVHIYINGVEASYDSQNNAIGSRNNDGDYNLIIANTIQAAQTFDGLIDEVRIYNRALTPSEITQLYKMGAARLTPDKTLVNVMKDSSLVGHWTFNGPDVSNAANLAYDRSGQGNNGTIYGAKPAIGKSGQALSFDGVDDYVDVGNNIQNSGPFTVSFWWKPNITYTSGSAAATIFSKYNDADRNMHIVLGYRTASKINFKLERLGPNRYEFETTTATWNTSNWYHIVWVHNISLATTKIYVNAADETNQYNSSGSYPTMDFAANIQIGGGQNENLGVSYVNATIDEVRIYNRALSASEVLRLYRASGGR